MSNEIQKPFVRSFISFLKKQIQDQSLTSDALESLEVAVQCLEAAFEVYSDDLVGGSDTTETVEPIDVYELYQTTYVESNPNRKELGESIKNDGNRLMKEGKFQEALLQYNRAITYDPKNPVFYCNRAAAFIRLGEHEKAVADCKLALVYNANYGKAFGRMGIAYSNLNKFDEARAAYQRALQIEPENLDYQNNLQIAEERCTSGNTPTANINIQMPANLANLASQLGSAYAGTGAGTGGANNPDGNTPNIANIIFNNGNPNMRNLFEGIMQDPLMTSALESLASNPTALLEMSRQVASAINSENPDFIRTVQQTINQIQQQGDAGDNPDPSSGDANNAEPRPDGGN